MQIIKTLDEWRSHRKKIPSTQSIGLIPTMGGLHAGHISLISRAQLENDKTVLTLFVNPTQFNNDKDYKHYPRNIEHDIEIAKKAGVDYLFIPEYAELYPEHYTYQITETAISQSMEGIKRPGHFQGMLTIVMKLLLIIRAHRAYFGEKDYQQLLLVQGLVKAFFLDTEIVACETIREASGLPLSSRNQLLSTEGKKQAEIFASIFQKTDLSLKEMSRELSAAHIETEYIQEEYGRRFCAVKIGSVRLIDNRMVKYTDSPF